MSTHVVVIATDLRRTTIKVNPGTYLSDVLHQACSKLNIDSNKYLIKHKQKNVDLSVPFRTSGLIQGAKLELVQKSNTPSAVQVALQLPQPEAHEIPGGRLIKKFPSDLSFWHVLRQFESGDASAGRNINITARGVAQVTGGTASGSGQLFYEMPVLNLMGREIASFEDFQKTLSQVGYNSGNVLIRLSYKKTDQPLYAAIERISSMFQQSGDATNTPMLEQPHPNARQPDVIPDEKALVGDGQDAPMPDAENAQRSSEPTEIGSHIQPGSSLSNENKEPQQVSEAPTSHDPYRPVNVFLAPLGNVPAAALESVDERDFTPTVAHAQLHQTRLLESSRNKRLLSDKELEDKALAEETKLASIKSVLVKVRFPDNTSSEWQIGPSETGSFLYEAVRHVMARGEQPFRLVLPGHGGGSVIKNDNTPRHNLIRTYKFSGRVLVNLVWDDAVPSQVRKQPFLRAGVAQQGKAVQVPEMPQMVEDKEAPPPVVKDPESKGKSGSGDGSGKKIPKWLKLGKK